MHASVFILSLLHVNLFGPAPFGSNATAVHTPQAKKDVSKDALLSDVCISTSAAPTYLPGHQFETKDKAGKPRAFNLIDGGVAANNPVSHHRHRPRIDTKLKNT